MLQAVPPQHHQPQLRVVVDIMVETQPLPARQVPLFVSFFHILSTLCILGDCAHKYPYCARTATCQHDCACGVANLFQAHHANARSCMHPSYETTAGSFRCQGQHALPAAENFRATVQQTVPTLFRSSRKCVSAVIGPHDAGLPCSCRWRVSTTHHGRCLHQATKTIPEEGSPYTAERLLGQQLAPFSQALQQAV